MNAHPRLPVDQLAPHLERRELPETQDGPLYAVDLHGHLIGWVWDRVTLELDGGEPAAAWLIASLPAKLSALVPGSLDDATFALAHHALAASAAVC